MGTDGAGRPAESTRGITFALLGYLLLFLLKLAAYLVTGVLVLLAEALRTLGDIFISGFLLLAARWSRRAPDTVHMFSYGRAQNVAARVAATIFISFTSYKLYEEAIPRVWTRDVPVVARLDQAVAVLLARMAVSAGPLLVPAFQRARGAAGRAQLLESINDDLGLLPDNACVLLRSSPGPEFLQKAKAIARSVGGVLGVYKEGRKELALTPRAEGGHAMKKLAIALALLAGLVLVPYTAHGHCDAVDGPVATAALKALDTKNVNLALPYAPAEAEAEITAAFEQALVVRAKGPEAKALADRYFMETVVRLHRAGEKAPYTGLKPAGIDFGPAIPAADKALETGALEPLQKLMAHAVAHGIAERFEHALHKKETTKEPGTRAGVPAARERVSAELGFVTYVEGVYLATKGAAHTE